MTRKEKAAELRLGDYRGRAGSLFEARGGGCCSSRVGVDLGDGSRTARDSHLDYYVLLVSAERLFAVLIAGVALMAGGAFTAFFASYPYWAILFVIVALGMLWAALKVKPTLVGPMARILFENGTNQPNLAYVTNVGDQTARNVRVQPITIGLFTTAFEEIQFLHPHEKQPLHVASGSYGDAKVDFVRMMEDFKIDRSRWLMYVTKDHVGDVTVPVVIHFLDLSGKEQTERQRLHVTAEQITHIRSIKPRSS